jgi:MoaA/NifB/PqqE/SkfB family radical SAM enzyme
MSKNCLYALGGINYKNGVISTCPRQADQLVYAHETILPSKIFNHKNFRDMRKLLHEDQWPQGCSTCEEMEKSDLKSMRFDYVLDTDNYFCKNKVGDDREIASKKLLDCYDNTDHSVTFEGLRHVEFRFSTACNFSCLHCSKVYSSGWTKKLKNYVPDKEDELYDLRQLLGTEHRHGPNDRNEMSLTTDEALRIVEDLNENFPNLAYVDVAGGEVLYQKQFFPTLRKLAEHPNAKNIHLSFHTNFNADFSVTELSDVLSFFGKSTIIISADAGKTFYSYFRHGGSWDKLKKNIKEFRDYNNFTYVDVSCTTSIYQMFDIYDVFESFFELGLNFDASIVQTPQYLDPSLIMYDFYDETMEDIRKTYKLIERMEKKAKSKMDLIKGNDAKKWLDYIVNYIKNTKISYNHFNRWLIYRKKSDIIWGQDFNQYFKNYQIIKEDLVRV